MRARRRWAVVAALATAAVVLFGLAACGDDDDGASAFGIYPEPLLSLADDAWLNLRRYAH